MALSERLKQTVKKVRDVLDTLDPAEQEEVVDLLTLAQTDPEGMEGFNIDEAMAYLSRLSEDQREALISSARKQLEARFTLSDEEWLELEEFMDDDE